MIITVSGIKKEYSGELTVRQLIETENVENPLYVTVALNDEFVRSADFESTLVNDGDTIEFLYFMGGGC